MLHDEAQYRRSNTHTIIARILCRYIILFLGGQVILPISSGEAKALASEFVGPEVDRSLQPRTIRDISWCIEQPALIRPLEQSGSIFPTDDWFAGLSTHRALALDPPPERFRLGIHFERIFQYWLTTNEDFDLLKANLQVQGSRDGQHRTLGEFDLLVAHEDVSEHWELAIKFYINVANPTRPGQWFGPDPNDTLASKMDKMIGHQLKLGEEPEAQTLLSQCGIELQRTRGIVKGRLYHPFASWQSTPHPDMVNPNHLRGWWLHEQEIETLFQPLAAPRVAYIGKQYWLSPMTPEDEVATLTRSELKDFMAATNQIAPQFVVLDDRGYETSRGFILKPEWFSRAAGQS